MRHEPSQVYTDIPFEDAVERVGKMLAAATWVISAVDPTREWERVSGPECITHVSDGNEEAGELPYASILTSPARLTAFDYGDVVIRIRDGRWAEERGLLLHEDFPVAIQRDLKGAGSLISVEPSPRYGDLGPYTAELCVGALNDRERKQRALRRAWQNDLIAINQQGLAPGLNGVTPTIAALTEAVTQGQPLPRLSPTSFRPTLAAAAGDLHPRAQRCLLTAEMLSPLMVTGLDASAVIVQYTKAVEIELGDKVLRPLKQYWADRPPPGPLTGHGTLQRLYSYLFRGRHIELGSASYAIKEALKESVKYDPVAQSTMHVLNRLPQPEWARKRLADDLLLLASTARNPAAHVEVFSAEDLPRVRRLVLGDDHEAGVLERLLTSD